MNGGTINDLKQFITATVSQQGAQLRNELREDIMTEVRVELRGLETRLEAKIDDLSAHVAGALETASNAADERLDDHERRLVQLERKAA